MVCTSVHTQFESLFFIAVVNSAGPFIARGYSGSRRLESHLSNDAAEEAAFIILERGIALPSQQLQFKGLRFRENCLMYLSLFPPLIGHQYFLQDETGTSCSDVGLLFGLASVKAEAGYLCHNHLICAECYQLVGGMKTWPAAIQNSASDC